ncbi:MAG: aminotransferase class I/II-fold pyridoxal phosphate-dependent enzyme [Actinomycetota bacterium]
MNTVELRSDALKAEVDLRTGLPYANLIRNHRRFASVIADHLGVDANHVLPTYGATGAIEAVRNHVFRTARKPNPVLLTVAPGYWRARESFQGFGFTVVVVETERDGFAINEPALIQKAHEVQPDIVYLSLPNNPSGAVFNPAAVLNGMPAETAVVFDLTLPSRQIDVPKLTNELYRDFQGRKLFIIASTSKSHNTAEYRIGWAVSAGSEDAAELMKENRNVVSSVSVEQALSAIRREPPVLALIEESFALLKNSAGSKSFQLIEPSRRAESSYLLIRVRCDAVDLRNSLERLGIGVMWGSEFGLADEYVRLEVSEPENVRAFLNAITRISSGQKTRP